MTGSRELQHQLKTLFAYKAEWLGPRLYDLFEEPAYFPALATDRPCVLIGGRGTGKTSVLRGLSYEGQAALQEAPPDRWPFFGLYIRVGTNRVQAFEGPDRSDDQWAKLFGHYFNLLVTREIVDFLRWFEASAEAKPSYSADDYEDMWVSLGPTNDEKPSSLVALRRAIIRRIDRFEAHLNDRDPNALPGLTISGVPIEKFFQVLLSLPAFSGRLFFLLIDEYENLTNYQQRVINTLVKHSTPTYTFKIAVKELGWRDRSVVGGSEKLTSPADYERIDISEAFRPETFRSFALSVCNERLNKLSSDSGASGRDIRKMLPSLPLDREAELLGINPLGERVLRRLSETFDGATIAPARALSPLQLYLFDYWAQAQDSTVEAVYRDFLLNRRVWETRYVNYKYALLFTIRRKKVGINKFYSGWDTYLQMAGGNIRYFLQLVEAALMGHLEKQSLSVEVDPSIQTRAAQDVGTLSLNELEGVDTHGTQLVRLVLGLGRVFQVMARHPSGHAPEVNQFYFKEDLGSLGASTTDTVADYASALLVSAVTHLALLRSAGTKLLDEASIRHHDYMIHPIFAALFEFSTRRKRKMQLSLDELYGIVHTPRKTIRQVLDRARRIYEDDAELPDQLLLFESFFRARPSSAESA